VSETTTQMLARLLDDALDALANAPGHLITRSGYCAKCEGGCIVDMGHMPVEYVPHPSWDAVKDQQRSVQAAKDYARDEVLAAIETEAALPVPALDPKSVLPPVTPIAGLDIRGVYDLLSPEARKELEAALQADARTRRAAAGAAATIPLGGKHDAQG